MVYVRTLQKQLAYDGAKQLSNPAPTLHEVHFSQVCYVPMNFGMSDFLVKHIGSWMLEFRSPVLTNQILHGYVLNSGTGALLIYANVAASDSTSVQIFSLGRDNI